jgi:hypothetical protein
MIAYHTSKGAVVNFTRALAGDWGRHGITVNAIAPGFFPSNLTTHDRGGWRGQNGGGCAIASPRRPGRSEGRSGLVRKRRRQTHHGPDTCHRRWFDGCHGVRLIPNIHLYRGMARAIIGRYKHRPRGGLPEFQWGLREAFSGRYLRNRPAFLLMAARSRKSRQPGIARVAQLG